MSSAVAQCGIELNRPMPANSTTSPSANCGRPLVRASLRANSVTPTMYSPTPQATTQCTACHASAVALMPNSTLSVRHAPIIERAGGRVLDHSVVHQHRGGQQRGDDRRPRVMREHAGRPTQHDTANQQRRSRAFAHWPR